jgi:hypothetical protein
MLLSPCQAHREGVVARRFDDGAASPKGRAVTGAFPSSGGAAPARKARNLAPGSPRVAVRGHYGPLPFNRLDAAPVKAGESPPEAAPRKNRGRSQRAPGSTAPRTWKNAAGGAPSGAAHLRKGMRTHKAWAPSGAPHPLVSRVQEFKGTTGEPGASTKNAGDVACLHAGVRCPEKAHRTIDESTTRFIATPRRRSIHAEPPRSMLVPDTAQFGTAPNKRARSVNKYSQCAMTASPYVQFRSDIASLFVPAQRMSRREA